MLAEKHRILPIVVGDISLLRLEMDDTLKSLLKSITWLEFPGKDACKKEMDIFWSLFLLSMPKKRQNNVVFVGDGV